jgi:two-component system response regulator RegX3
MARENKKGSILIIEDEAPIRDGLADVFVFNGYEVDVAADGPEGLRKALEGNYHLILLDLMLPGLDGMSICNEIRQVDRSQPIIMLTAKGQEEDIIAGLKQGADDYVPKPFSIRELLARVEAVLRRSQKLSASKETIEWDGLTIDPLNLTLRIGDKTLELTSREIDILRYLILCSDRPVSRQELLKEVWGYANAQMETRTVDIHIAKLRKKIETDPQEPQYITTVRGQGYRIGHVNEAGQ